MITTLKRLARTKNVVVLVDASSMATMQAWGCMRLARYFLLQEMGTAALS